MLLSRRLVIGINESSVSQVGMSAKCENCPAIVVESDPSSDVDVDVDADAETEDEEVDRDEAT